MSQDLGTHAYRYCTM